MKDGTVRRSIQEQSGGAVAAAGKRKCWRGGERDWRVDADIGTLACKPWSVPNFARILRCDGQRKVKGLARFWASPS